MRLALLLALPLIALAADDAWTVRAGAIDPAHYYGVTVANGMLGMLSSPEPLRMGDVVLNGVYDTYGRGRVDNIVRGFRFMNLALDVDGKPARAAGLAQSLDMRHAMLASEFDASGKLHVRHQVAALRQLPYSAIALVDIEARADATVTVANAIETPDVLRDVHNSYQMLDRPHARIGLATSVARTPTGRHTIAASTAFLFEPGERPELVHEEFDYGTHTVKFTRKLKRGDHLRFALVGSMLASNQAADPLNEAERLTIYAALEGRERLLAAHDKAWDQLWRGDIVIDGDAQTQRDARFMLYHLYSFVRAGTAYSPSPMGLSGLGYNGHVFWDAELWMYPPLLALQPALARSMLEYRYERLDAARRNAFSHGYRGAMFPWESASEGQETTPVWALTGPFQQHITGDIGWAFWKYYLATGDKAWLRERGYPVLKEVADFWASRVERNGPGHYDIRNVIGADEWQENIDNNAFTNGMAVTVLRYAAQAARELGIAPDPDWELVAANIPLPAFPDGTTREHATYAGVPVKQADANLLSYPLDVVAARPRIEQDLAYYEPRLSPEGPAMSWSVLATLHARLGHPDQALALFKRSYEPNRLPPFGVLAETAGGTNPYFATGAGGTLQALVFGFAGLDLEQPRFPAHPAPLPKGWKSVTIRRASGQ
jgi:trehalose/maltose hydrolase-like predicted phosphorylase